jgi:hypothetical protein
VKTLTYTGVHSAVTLPQPSGMSYECERDGTVDLPDELAKELLERDDWKLAKSTKKKPAKGKE